MRIAAVLVAFMAIAIIACGGAGSSTTTSSVSSSSTSSSSKPRPKPTTSSAPSPSPKSSTPKKEPIVDFGPDPELQAVIDWIRAGRPKVTRLKVGAMGAVDGLSIVQVIDDRTALCMVDDSLQTVMVQGFNMRNQADGQKVGLPLVHVTHTTQYTSVLGATKTVFVLQGVNRIGEAEEEIAKEDAQETARQLRAELAEAMELEKQEAETKRLAEEEAAKMRDAEFRTWRSANGQFTIDARLDRYSPGKAVLEKRDGEKIDVDEKQLSDDDQKFLQEEMKRRLRGR